MFNSFEELKDKKILVVGLGRTGIQLTKLLVKHKAKVTVSDHKSKPELANAMEALNQLDINYELEGHKPKNFIEQDLIILSPGVSPNLKIFEYARSQGVHVTGEVEFCSAFVKEPIIAVTGTNGKTTTCQLIELMLKESGVSCWLGGNYGSPLSEYLLYDVKAQVVILEVSSFMLEHVQKFSPNNIVFTNLAENHLDRYRSIEEYINAKRKIFTNTSFSTTSILNADDNAVVELARDPVVQKGKIYYYSKKPALEPQIMNIGGAVNINKEIRVRTSPDINYYSLQEMKVIGKHSVDNIMAAILAAREHGAKSDCIQKIINTFRGIAHRLEYVRKIGGVRFYNDSKSTNVHAVIRALDSFEDNVILIAGGKDANINFRPLASFIRRKVKSLILIGEAKERINRDIGDFSETFLIGTFEEAVHVAYQKSRIGDTILLSPGCPSFDMFDNYIERGQYFRDIVNNFK